MYVTLQSHFVIFQFLSLSKFICHLYVENNCAIVLKIKIGWKNRKLLSFYNVNPILAVTKLNNKIGITMFILTDRLCLSYKTQSHDDY